MGNCQLCPPIIDAPVTVANKEYLYKIDFNQLWNSKADDGRYYKEQYMVLLGKNPWYESDSAIRHVERDRACFQL